MSCCHDVDDDRAVLERTMAALAEVGVKTVYRPTECKRCGLLVPSVDLIDDPGPEVAWKALLVARSSTTPCLACYSAQLPDLDCLAVGLGLEDCGTERSIHAHDRQP